MGEPPKFEVSYSRSVDSFEVSGRERPVNTPRAATEQKIKVEGAIYSSDVDTERKVYDYIQHAGHVYARSHDGMWAQACVKDGGIVRVVDGVYTIELSLNGEIW